MITVCVDGAEVGEVKRMWLCPGDVLVLESPVWLPTPVMEELQRRMASLFPDHGCVVLADGLILGVMSREPE